MRPERVFFDATENSIYWMKSNGRSEQAFGGSLKIASLALLSRSRIDSLVRQLTSMLNLPSSRALSGRKLLKCKLLRLNKLDQTLALDEHRRAFLRIRRLIKRMPSNVRFTIGANFKMFKRCVRGDL